LKKLDSKPAFESVGLVADFSTTEQEAKETASILKSVNASLFADDLLVSKQIILKTNCMIIS